MLRTIGPPVSMSFATTALPRDGGIEDERLRLVPVHRNHDKLTASNKIVKPVLSFWIRLFVVHLQQQASAPQSQETIAKRGSRAHHDDIMSNRAPPPPQLTRGRFHSIRRVATNGRQHIVDLLFPAHFQNLDEPRKGHNMCQSVRACPSIFWDDVLTRSSF